MQNLSVLILAAGKGKRMRSDLPKVLHPLAGRPLLSHVLETAKKLHPKRILVVVGHGASQVQKAVAVNGFKVSWVYQRRQFGTADAVRSAERYFGNDPLLILSGDVPLLRDPLLKELQRRFQGSGAALALLTTELRDPKGYGRVVRNGTGEVKRIVEEKEATAEEKEICEVNTGVYLARPQEILPALHEVQKRGGKEYYLTDLVEILLKKGKKVVPVKTLESEACLGINNREQLILAEEELRRRINQGWMKRGVILKNPDTVSIGPEVKIEPDVVIHQGVVLEGKTRIGQGAVILPYTVIEDSKVGRGARVGPFAHLRPGSDVGPDCRIGNFVELKKTKVKKGAKANHLTYLGDAVVGEETNVGCGTITCNYDGFKKHKTVIGKKVFIGSDVQFVAPVKIQSGAWIGAGTTVTRNVPSGALAISRVKQENIKGWVHRKKEK